LYKDRESVCHLVKTSLSITDKVIKRVAKAVVSDLAYRVPSMTSFPDAW
jgi:hypothetical protein